MNVPHSPSPGPLRLGLRGRGCARNVSRETTERRSLNTNRGDHHAIERRTRKPVGRRSQVGSLQWSQSRRRQEVVGQKELLSTTGEGQVGPTPSHLPAKPTIPNATDYPECDINQPRSQGWTRGWGAVRYTNLHSGPPNDRQRASDLAQRHPIDRHLAPAWQPRRSRETVILSVHHMPVSGCHRGLQASTPPTGSTTGSVRGRIVVSRRLVQVGRTATSSRGRGPVLSEPAQAPPRDIEYPKNLRSQFWWVLSLWSRSNAMIRSWPCFKTGLTSKLRGSGGSRGGSTLQSWVHIKDPKNLKSKIGGSYGLVSPHVLRLCASDWDGWAPEVSGGFAGRGFPVLALHAGIGENVMNFGTSSLCVETAGRCAGRPGSTGGGGLGEASVLPRLLVGHGGIKVGKYLVSPCPH